jgi:hypothetical protein
LIETLRDELARIVRQGALEFPKNFADRVYFLMLLVVNENKKINRRLNISLEAIGAGLDMRFLFWGRRNVSAVVIAVVIFVIIQMVPDNAHFFRQSLLY